MKLIWKFNLVLLGIFTVLPMAWMLLTSVKTQFAALQYPPEWIPSEPTLEQYTRLLSPANEVPPTTPDVASLAVAFTCWPEAPNRKLGPGDATSQVIVGA